MEEIAGHKIHPAASLFPLVRLDEFDALAADILTYGLRRPITTDPDGLVLDGRNRLRACEVVGISPRFEAYDGDPIPFIVSTNIHRRHLTASQRAMISADLLPELEKQAKERQGSRTDKHGGKNSTMSGKARDQAAALTGTNGKYVSDAKRLSEESPELADKVRSGELSIPAAKREAQGKPHVSHNSGQNEWYTPADIIEAARYALGGFELDPASSELANKTVQADRFFSREENGLKHDWLAETVWMNPPYSQPEIGQFIDKLVGHVNSGDVGSAIVLVNNGTETKWGQALLGNASSLCFPSSRIRFISPDGEKGAPLQGQMIVGLGDIDGEVFAESFECFGRGIFNVG